MDNLGKANTPARRLEYAADVATQRYLENTFLQASILAIPYIGGPLDALLVSAGSKVIRQRHERLLQHLKAKMVELEAGKVNRAFIESEEFLHLFLKALDYAARTTRNERIVLIAHALAGSTTREVGRRLRDDLEDILEISASLTLPEAALLREMVEVFLAYVERAMRGDEGGVSIMKVYLESSLQEIVADTRSELLIRLARKGLIQEITGAFLGYTGGRYVPTVIGCKVVSLLTLRPLQCDLLERVWALFYSKETATVT